MGEKECMYIKDWFKPVIPLFLNLLRKFPNARGRTLHSCYRAS